MDTPRSQKRRSNEWSTTELIERCRARDDDAWQELLLRYSRLIYSTIWRTGLLPVEQEDAFQATVAAIYREIDRLRDPQRLAAWIIRIAWRQSVNCIRRRPREVPLEVPGTDGAVAPDPPSSQPLPDEILVLLERAQQAHEALQALAPRCRRLLAYFFYEDPAPDYAEVARREGVPIGSLGPTRARCLAQMRSYFRKRGWL